MTCMRVATHPGTFHADDVFAIAALRLAHVQVEIVRTRDEEAQAAADVRVDVGGRSDPATGDYDHHQRGGAGERANGIRALIRSPAPAASERLIISRRVSGSRGPTYCRYKLEYRLGMGVAGC